MRRVLRSKRLYLDVQIALLAVAGCASPFARAQTTGAQTSSAATQAKTLQEVVVTGSRIRQVDLQDQQPVVTVSRPQIEATGLTSVTNILGRINSVQTDPGTNRQTTQGGTSGSFPDMRGLGASRVLVLVNGHRWMTNNNGETNLATIPASIISRIEVLKDGASAVYGSDAVSGVINIITRKKFKGLEVSANYGENQKGDGRNQQYSVTMGSGVTKKGSIMLNLAYNSQGIMWNRTRDLTRYPQGPLHPDASWYQVGTRGSFTNSQGLYILNKVGLNTTNFANYTKYDPSDIPQSAKTNLSIYKPFRTPRWTKSLYVQGQYNFTSNLSFYDTTTYVENRAFNQMAGFPSQSHYFNLTNGMMSKNSIYNPVDQNISYGIDYVLHPRTVRSNIKSVQEIAGLKGSFQLNDHSWLWNVGLNYSKISGISHTLNNLNYWYIQRAIGPSFVNADGTPQCRSPGNILSDCIPLNILAGQTALDANPELAKKIFIRSQDNTLDRTMSYSANMNGGLFNIPFGGTVALALGAQHRGLTGSDVPDAFTQSGLSSNNVAAGTKGSFFVNAVYGELAVPLLKNLTGANLLLVDLATRHSYYSNFGGTTDSKFSLEYRPIKSLMFRANWAQAFRAPTINDLDAGRGQGFGDYTDPCDAKFGAAVYGASVHAACVASLAAAGFPNPAHFRQQLGTGAPIASANQQTKHAFLFGGNPNLGPETAIDKTLGFVYSPPFVSGLGITVDWYSVKISNIISPVTANDALQQCYQGVQSFCNRFTRGPDGQVLNLLLNDANRGRVAVNGYDLEVTYRSPQTGFGEFGLRAQVNYTSKWDAQAEPGAPVDHRVGLETDDGDFWRIRSNVSVTWRRSRWGATWRIRYFSSLTEGCFWGTKSECNNPNHIDPFRGPFPQNRLGAITFNDVSVTWHSPWRGVITLGSNDVFNRKPPIDYQAAHTGAPINPAYDIGRFWFVSYRQRFL